MVGIKILGASGGRSREALTTCIQVSANTVIDAGNILSGMGKYAKDVNSIFFSHAHLDHIVDSAFLVDNQLASRTKSFQFYGLSQTLETMQKHIFNWEIWPDFSKVYFKNTTTPVIQYCPLKIGEKYTVDDGVSLEPIASEHTIPTCGYIISKNNQSILFTADTYINDSLWLMVNERKDINAIIVDVSFPNSLRDIAKKSKHLTAEALQMQMKLLKRNVPVYINHLKPALRDEVIADLSKIGISSEYILEDGVILGYDGKIFAKTDSIDEKIKKLNFVGTSLSSTNDLSSLLEMIVSEAKNLTKADGGTLYIKNKNTLEFKVIQTDSLNIRMGGKSGKIEWKPLNLYLENGKANKQMVAALCALENRVINIPDVYKAKNFIFTGTKTFDENTGYHSQSMLVIPLRDHENSVIGVLQLINKKDKFADALKAFDKDDEEITLSLASQAAVSISKVLLLNDLEKLLESFLKSIVYAFRKKSSYTAGHIHKMVDLSKMMAQAINDDTEIFKNKNFSADNLKEINFAALMHDVGKLSTPDYILDKSTKLDGLFDRIEIVKIRAWAIKKELEIDFLKKNILEETYIENNKKLDEDLALLVQSNFGTEFVLNEVIQRIKLIAEVPYICDGKELYLITHEEAEFLMIRKGTLSETEREIINNHAQISIDILKKLHFPNKYKNIPEISGNHHEKINGKGYPQGLKGDAISFEARILAITDIFEALTADDRPYKKPNNLSTAMRILHSMASNNELDKNIVRFFYESGLYLTYAKKYLNKDNIDEVYLDFSDF